MVEMILHGDRCLSHTAEESQRQATQRTYVIPHLVITSEPLLESSPLFSKLPSETVSSGQCHRRLLIFQFIGMVSFLFLLLLLNKLVESILSLQYLLNIESTQPPGGKCPILQKRQWGAWKGPGQC